MDREQAIEEAVLLRQWLRLQLRQDDMFCDDGGPLGVFDRYLYIEGQKRRDWLFDWFIRNHHGVAAIELAPESMPHLDEIGYRPFVLHTFYAPDMTWKKVAAKWFPSEPISRKSQDVYFIRAGKNGPIKIGIAQDTADRMSQLQCGCAWPLEIIGCITDGGQKLEAKLHKQFASIRMSGEWFEPTRELIEFINSSTT